jgi:hypothetical protein
MSKAEAGNSSMFFIRHLTLLNPSKNVKFRKSFNFGALSLLLDGARTRRSPLAQGDAL